MKKIKVNKKTANFLKYVEATIFSLAMMLGMVGCTSLTPFTTTGWIIETIMIIMLLVLSEIEEKPDINNAEYVSNVNGNEQQQSHDRNKKDESSLLFLIIFMYIVLIASSIK